MSQFVAVHYRTPAGSKLSFQVDLDDPQVHSIELRRDVTLHVDRSRTPPRWFAGYPWYQRCPDIEAERGDGWVHAKVPDVGGIVVVRRISPQAWKLSRTYWTVEEDAAKEAARFCEVPLPGGEVEEVIPQALRDARKMIPQALRAATKAHKDLYPRSVNVPRLLRLIAEGWELAKPSAREIEIPLDQIIERCHRGKTKTPLKTIQTTTIRPTQLVIDDARIPLSITLTETCVRVELRLPEVDGGQLGV
jgi:hypothetical protein